MKVGVSIQSDIFGTVWDHVFASKGGHIMLHWYDVVLVQQIYVAISYAAVEGPFCIQWCWYDSTCQSRGLLGETCIGSKGCLTAGQVLVIFGWLIVQNYFFSLELVIVYDVFELQYHTYVEAIFVWVHSTYMQQQIIKANTQRTRLPRYCFAARLCQKKRVGLRAMVRNMLDSNTSHFMSWKILNATCLRYVDMWIKFEAWHVWAAQDVQKMSATGNMVEHVPSHRRGCSVSESTNLQTSDVTGVISCLL